MINVRNHTLLTDIEAFLTASGMGPSYFGKCAVGNSELVARLRGGGRVWPETAEAIRAFIHARSREHSHPKETSCANQTHPVS
jgi:hypothetical protein